MSKKYTIVNGTFTNTDFCVDYLFYILIFILVIYTVIQFMIINYYDYFFETFDNSSNQLSNNTNTITNTGNQPITITASPNKAITQSEKYAQQHLLNKTPNKVVKVENKPMTIEQELQQIKSLNNALELSKQTLENVVKKQERSIYLSNNYYKIDDTSYINELNFINNDFMDVKLPSMDFKNKKIIESEKELNDYINKCSEYKNIYKVGDVVLKSSDDNITKDDICYKDHANKLSVDPEFKQKYPECMVCSVNPESDYSNTKSWKNTKTNIQKVCLFNPVSSSDTSILNYDGCKKLCKL